jgi:NAD-dependent SIR2 family protein deacetylase
MEKEELISYCGLYCGDCFGYEGKIATLADELDIELKKVNFKKNADFFAQMPFFKVFKNYDNFIDLLGALKKLRCVGCREGGGSPTCEIRACCKDKEIEGCWKCDEFNTCQKLDFLQNTHEEAVVKNLNILKDKGVDSFLSGDRYWSMK